jgi:hypothetical protein
MKQKVTITRTDAGVTTAVMSSAYEWSKSYTSWDQALDEAVDLQLLNKVESAAACRRDFPSTAMPTST